MDFERIAIIGANHISVSIALGLKAQKEPPQIIGYDANSTAADLACAHGAFDHVERKPEQACQDADLVIVAVPLPAIRDTFITIAPHLKPGCCVTDTADLKAPVSRWAEELLPKNVCFVGGNPILNPVTASLQSPEELEKVASADLLKGALYCLTSPVGPCAEAIDAFVGMAEELEAHPFFIDATEHDGLQAGVEALPDMLAIALLRATVDTPGWQEMRKFAGHHFAVATGAAGDAHEQCAAIFLNRENVLRRLDVLLSELVRLRDLLTHDDVESLEETFVAATEGRAHWIKERGQGMWGGERATDMDHIPSVSEQVGRIFFGDRLARRLAKDTDNSRKE